MKRLITTAVFAAVVALLPNPVPAEATAAQSCLLESVESCDGDFPGSDPYTAAVRGWCYMIRIAICEAFD
jgi:hypothetical protein